MQGCVKKARKVQKATDTVVTWSYATTSEMAEFCLTFAASDRLARQLTTS